MTIGQCFCGTGLGDLVTSYIFLLSHPGNEPGCRQTWCESPHPPAGSRCDCSFSSCWQSQFPSSVSRCAPLLLAPRPVFAAVLALLVLSPHHRTSRTFPLRDLGEQVALQLLHESAPYLDLGIRTRSLSNFLLGRRVATLALLLGCVTQPHLRQQRLPSRNIG